MVQQAGAGLRSQTWSSEAEEGLEAVEMLSIARVRRQLHISCRAVLQALLKEGRWNDSAVSPCN